MKFDTKPDPNVHVLLFLAFFFWLVTVCVLVLGIISLIMFYAYA